MKLTNEDVQGILELLDATKFDELHLETERFKLTLRRNKESGDWSQEMQIISAPNVPATLPVANISEAAASAGAATNPSVLHERGVGRDSGASARHILSRGKARRAALRRNRQLR